MYIKDNKYLKTYISNATPNFRRYAYMDMILVLIYVKFQNLINQIIYQSISF